MTSSLIFKQLFDQASGTYSYLLADADSREALLIDSVYEQYERDLALIRELGLTLIACVETHCHADHVTGAWLLKSTLGCQLIASPYTGIEVIDREVRDGDVIEFGRQRLHVIATPGHTEGCISLVLQDHSAVLTGDSLLIRGCGRTDFQRGSAKTMFHSIKEKLFTLPDDYVVYPAHDYSGRTASSIGEERTLNPRIGGEANEADFVGFMENMRLPHPKQIDVAVPANLKGGIPKNAELPKQPDWAPVVTTYSGVLEISPQWVAQHMQDVRIVDVRTTVESDEESARLQGALMIPINELRNRLDEIPDDKPIMTICRSGKRSVLAFSILRDAGRQRVASVKGGLLRWYEEGLPVL